MDAYQHAIRFLSRREHSGKELTDKLILKGYCLEDITFVINQLSARGLQSDTRYVEGMVRVRLGQGKGPLWIIAELTQHALSKDLIQNAVYAQEHDWFAQAAAVRAQKFGLASPENLAQKAKQIRFLQYRGFENEHIRVALEARNDV